MPRAFPAGLFFSDTRHGKEILPRFSEKRQTVEIADEIEHSITKYLVIVTMMNAAVGLATGALMWAFGFADPILWGTAAFLLNYIPILGPLVGVLVFFAAGLLTFDSPWYAIFPAGGYLLIHVIEGENVTPMLLASRLTLNPVFVLLSVFFWYALWGVAGALLAGPLLSLALAELIVAELQLVSFVARRVTRDSSLQLSAASRITANQARGVSNVFVARVQ